MQYEDIGAMKKVALVLNKTLINMLYTSVCWAQYARYLVSSVQTCYKFVNM